MVSRLSLHSGFRRPETADSGVRTRERVAPGTRDMEMPACRVGPAEAGVRRKWRLRGEWDQQAARPDAVHGDLR